MSQKRWVLTKAGVETNLAQAYIFRGWGTVAGELELQKWHSKYCPCSSKDILISRKGALENLNGSESSNWPQFLVEMELEPWSQDFLHTASKISLQSSDFPRSKQEATWPRFKICYPLPQPHELGLSNFPSIFCLRLPQSPTQKEPVSRLHCPGLNKFPSEESQKISAKGQGIERVLTIFLLHYL